MSPWRRPQVGRWHPSPRRDGQSDGRFVSVLLLFPSDLSLSREKKMEGLAFGRAACPEVAPTRYTAPHSTTRVRIPSSVSAPMSICHTRTHHVLQQPIPCPSSSPTWVLVTCPAYGCVLRRHLPTSGTSTVTHDGPPAATVGRLRQMKHVLSQIYF